MKTKKTSRPKFKGFDYEDGRIVKTAYFDGYSFGDRLLEGVWFKATIQEDGTLEVEPCKKSESYLATLNRNYWIKEALQYAEGNDLFSECEGGSESDLELLPIE